MAGCCGGGVSAIFQSLHVVFYLLVLVTVYAQRDVRVPPKITKPSVSSAIYRRLDDQVILQCEATGTPAPTYTWHRVDKDKNQLDMKDVIYDAYNGTLKISKLTEVNEGRFYCTASNSFLGGYKATTQSRTITVLVGRVKKWDVSKEIIKKTFDQYSYAYLKCDQNIPEFVGPTRFKWYTISADGEDQKILPKDPRRFIDKDGTLHFAYVLKSDERSQNEFYSCALSNAIEGFIRRGQKQELIVRTDSAGDSIRAPVLEYPKDRPTYEVLLHSEAKLDCFISGYTDQNGEKKLYDISWNFTPHKEEAGTAERFVFEDNNRVMRILKVEQYDEQDYTCSVRSNLGSVEGTMSLNVTSPPIWETALQSQTVTEDEDVVFECVANSAMGERDPNPPQWKRNSRELVLDRAKYRVDASKQQLTLMGAKKKDDVACFQCFVSNSVGEIFSDACLNVVLQTKLLTQPQRMQVVNEGDIVNLTVVAKGDPLYQLSYEWFYRNASFKEPLAPPYVDYDPVTKLAIINTTGFTSEEMTDIEGVYSRAISNTLHTMHVDVEVKYAGKPVVVPVAEAGFDYWIIALIIGILLIIIAILLICCVICRRKMLEGDYPVDRKEVAAGMDPEKELKDSGFHDLSRADYDFLPEKKGPNMDFDDDQIPLGDDESFGSEYGGEEDTAFNERGSFIGLYKGGSGKVGPPAYSGESKV
ncbi:hypothetical protein ACOMHN_063561 [Nucella lapillus]